MTIELRCCVVKKEFAMKENSKIFNRGVNRNHKVRSLRDTPKKKKSQELQGHKRVYVIRTNYKLFVVGQIDPRSDKLVGGLGD